MELNQMGPFAYRAELELTRTYSDPTATDVLCAIDQLRRDLSGYHGQLKAHDDLQRHCGNQRKRIAELEAIHARDAAEIAELKEQTRWMDQTDSRWEAAVRDLEQVKAENAKLRELVQDMWPHVRHRSRMCGECDLPCDESDECLLYGPMRDSMRELGVEI